MDTKPNVIILTSGLSGSSVLTGLICRAGYWTGNVTHKKPQYDTFENEALIELNLRLFRDAGYGGNYLMEFSQDAVERIAAHYGRANHRAYQDFVDNCERHRPWIWKDPRLWLTIRFWKNFMPLQHCRFILLTRDLTQTWISQTLRRQITTFRYSRNYELSIQSSVVQFFQRNSLPHLRLSYEDLIVQPAPCIRYLNEFLGTSLTVEDLKAVYRKPLYKSPRSSMVRHLKAFAIYVKNYSERLDLTVPMGPRD
jgi:hypothetical protein